MKKIIGLMLSYLLLNSRRRNKVNNSRAIPEDFPYAIEIVAGNLVVPWAIALSDDGKVYFTERPGRIRVIESGKLLEEPLITFGPPFISPGEGGLMGIVLDPDFSKNHYLYVMHTYEENNQIFNRVVRLIEEENKASIDKVLIDKIPGGRIHDGGRIKIGPDKKLYITAGDAANPDLAQNLSSLGGKILRIELDGSIPKDNPFPGSPVLSYGHRNPEGLAWSNDNTLYASEHGQIAHDEINIIIPGANYGWPLVEGYESAENINTKKPLVQSGEETWAPSGIAFIKEGPWKGHLLAANLRGQQLLSFLVDEEAKKIKAITPWLKNEFGRLREVISSKDGTIYLTTSNRDGRGNPDKTDDKIIRLVPKN